MELSDKDKIELLRAQNNELINCLIEVIKSAAHPAVAIRVVMVDLKPIRKTLRNVGVNAPELGI